MNLEQILIIEIYWLNTKIRSQIQQLELVNAIKDINIPPDSILVRFDVENLFPSIPYNETLPLIKNLLYKSDLPDYVCENLLMLLNLCLSQNFVQFNEKI